jgi:hypothetical protein
MSHSESLADQAVTTLAAVAAMDNKVTNDHPERHAIRNLKRTAQDILSSALRQARDLAYQAEQLHEDMARVRAASPQAEKEGE